MRRESLGSGIRQSSRGRGREPRELRPGIRSVLAQLREELAKRYGARLRGIYLYGSYARGEEDVESDLDVLIVLDRIERYGVELEGIGPLISRLSLDCGISISVVFKTEDDWLRRQTPFLRNVQAEAVPA